MKKLFIFILGLISGVIICGLFMSYKFPQIHQWQTKNGLAAMIDWELIYKKQLESNKLDVLSEILNKNIKDNSEHLIALDKERGGTKDPYLKSVIDRVEKTGIELDLDNINEYTKKFNQ